MRSQENKKGLPDFTCAAGQYTILQGQSSCREANSGEAAANGFLTTCMGLTF